MATLLAAQPIYNRHLEVAGSELLYRDDSGKTALDIGDTAATSELLFNLCTGLTEQFEQFEHPVFINVSSDFLTSGAFLPVAPDKVIIELVERIKPTPKIIESIRAWKEEGFKFALDDFEFTDDWEPLVELASIIKVDIETTPLNTIKEHKKRLKSFQLKWVAERIETEEQFNQYKDLGFDLFQGYFLAHPKPITGEKIQSGSLQFVRVLRELFVDNPDIAGLSGAISADPTLSMTLIRVANSPFYGTQRTIKSIKEVILLLGLNEVKKWVILMNSLKLTTPAAVHLVLTRANACSELALLESDSKSVADEAFLAGLLSGAHILLNVNKEAFIRKANVSDSIRDAALNYEGQLGSYIRDVLEVETEITRTGVLNGSDAELIKCYQQSNLKVQLLLQEAI